MAEELEVEVETQDKDAQAIIDKLNGVEQDEVSEDDKLPSDKVNDEDKPLHS